MSVLEREIFNQNGLPPFRTGFPGPHYVKKDDPDHAKPQVVQEVRVRVFDLAVAEDLDAFNKALMRVAMGAGYVQSMDKQFCQETGSWKVLLIWYELYQEMPKETHSRREAFFRGEGCL